MTAVLSGIRLIVGLGNPGPEYEKTRHNVGFWFVDRFLTEQRGRSKMEAKFFGEVSRLTLLSEAEIWLLKPMTFMNLSGQAVAAFSRFYKIAPEEILVVHDELDLAPGIVRLKCGGGHGGHNGIKNIATSLGTADFWRARIGIGHPGERREVVQFVLKAPRTEEREAIESAIYRTLGALPLILAGNMLEGMRVLHTSQK